MELHLRPKSAAVLLALGLMAIPASADAAKLKIGGGTLPVDDDGVAAIKLKNPNGSAAKGTLTLKSGGQSIGSHGFKVRARRSSTVRVAVTHVDALQILANGDGLRTTVAAKAKGKGTARKNLVLFYPGASSGGGGSQGGGQQQQPVQASSDGRWQGTWETNSADLAFNIGGTRLYTGPFDAFYLTLTCADGRTDSSAMEPIEATISPNGDFSGSGVYRPDPSISIPWTLTGHISGRTLTGTLSAERDFAYHGHCVGSANFTASWYGAYTL